MCKNRTSFLVRAAGVSSKYRFRVNKPTTFEEVKKIMKEAADGHLKDVLGYTEEDCVSSDFNHTSYSCIFDARAGIPQTSTFIKIIAW